MSQTRDPGIDWLVDTVVWVVGELADWLTSLLDGWAFDWKHWFVVVDELDS